MREPSLAGAETLALAVLDDAHANLERDFAALAFAAADPMPVAFLARDQDRIAPIRRRSRNSWSHPPMRRTRYNSQGHSRQRSFLEARLRVSRSSLSTIQGPNAYFDPTPIGPANPIVVASLGLVPISPTSDLATAEPPKNDFHYLAYYVYSESPPPEKPAKIALAALREGRSARDAHPGDRTRGRSVRCRCQFHEIGRQNRIRF